MTEDRELASVRERYARRADVSGFRYSRLNPEVLARVHDRQVALVRLLLSRNIRSLRGLHIVEVGCGSGGNLLELVEFGADPERITGIELLPERHAQARRILPEALRLVQGDAAHADIAPATQDVVLQSTVFSSLLDDAFQQRLADAMWRWLKPGGGVLWYDFTIDNPRNPDVRGVPLSRVRALFPHARIAHRRVTLAPPLARAACRVHPMLYTVLNALPVLRTHVLAWIEKPS